MNDILPPADDYLESLPLPGAAAVGRPCWTGLLQSSLVCIPLKAYPAVRTRDVPVAHLLHAGCGRRLRYAKHCPVHGPVDAAAVVRGFEYGLGQHVLVQADELDHLRPAQERALRLERFVTPAQVDPLLYGGRSLYLVPDGPAAQSAFEVLYTAMRQRGRWALGRVVLNGHRQLVVVRPAATVLVLQVLQYPELVRPCPPPRRGGRPTPKKRTGKPFAWMRRAKSTSDSPPASNTTAPSKPARVSMSVAPGAAQSHKEGKLDALANGLNVVHSAARDRSARPAMRMAE